MATTLTEGNGSYEMPDVPVTLTRPPTPSALVLKGPVLRTACGPETGPKWTEMDQTFGPSPCF